MKTGAVHSTVLDIKHVEGNVSEAATGGIM